jgi:DNA polymerase III delta' subunit
MDGVASATEGDLILRGNEIPAGILGSALRSGRIANAYLLKGPRGSPKEALALSFAKGLLCDVKALGQSGEACGQCWSCRAVSNHAHPDFLEVEKEGSTIKIRKSHEILKEALSKPYHSTRKVFLIRDAEDLTAEASNALLKVLEEPPAYVTFLLTAANMSAIPETIISRCQMVPFRKLQATALEEILLRVHGADARAASEATLHADGSLERALRILERHQGSAPQAEETLNEVLQGSAVDLALKYSKVEPARRVDVLTDLEIELVRRLRTRVPLLDSEEVASKQVERELRRIYRALKSLLKAKERLDGNTNAFLTLSVLFMDLARTLGD